MPSIALRRFTTTGMSAVQEALDRLDLGEVVNLQAILVDDRFTEVLIAGSVVDVRAFANRRQAGEYLYNLLVPLEDTITDIERDRGLWTWLALAWVDVLAPAEDDGTRRLKDRARWVAVVDDYRKYYRHLLAGPYRIYRAHKDDPERAMAVLATVVERPGEVVEQFASRQEMITNPNLMSAITSLYYDPATGRLKSGAGGKAHGSARRLVDVLQQFDVTWDIYGMEPDEILDLLPGEFHRFAAA